MQTECGSVRLSLGLREGVDQDLEALLQLWEEMLAVSVEAAQAPELDPNLFTFAENCFFFSVIMVEAKEKGKEVDGKKCKDSTTSKHFGGMAQNTMQEHRDWKHDFAPRQAANEMPDEIEKETVNVSGNEINIAFGYDREKESGNEMGVKKETEVKVKHESEGGVDKRNPGPSENASENCADTLSFEQVWDVLKDEPSDPIPPEDDSDSYMPIDLFEGREADDILKPHWQVTSEFPTTSFYPATTQPSGPSVAGFVYCITSPHTAGPAGEVNIGIILRRQFRGKGYARQAIELTLKWVFEDVHFHRVQAALMDTLDKDKALALFTQLGFGHEGTRRRALFSATDGTWKDVTYLAMLDTEWMMRAFFTPAPKSIWDELFARHERERRELLQWEDTKARLKRTSSMETVRLDVSGARASPKKPKSNLYEEPSANAQSSGGKGKARFISPSDTGSPPPPSDSEDGTDYFTDDESSVHGADLSSLLRKPANVLPSSRSSSSSRSLSSAESSSTGSPGSSQWDLLETSSARSSSAFESIHGSDLED